MKFLSRFAFFSNFLMQFPSIGACSNQLLNCSAKFIKNFEQSQPLSFVYLGVRYFLVIPLHVAGFVRSRSLFIKIRNYPHFMHLSCEYIFILHTRSQKTVDLTHNLVSFGAAMWFLTLINSTVCMMSIRLLQDKIA